MNKAKLMLPLGDAEFAEIDADVTKGKLPEALDILQHYRDEVDSCDKALDATGGRPKTSCGLQTAAVFIA